MSIKTYDTEVRVDATGMEGAGLEPVRLIVRSGSAWLQTYLTPDQAHQLAAELMVVADEVESAAVAS